MSNQLPANVANLAPALAQSVAAAGANNTGESYMRFTKRGSWEFGAESIEVEEGSLWAINPAAFMHGWIAWKQGDTGGGPKGERMVPATQPMPEEHELPDVDGVWSKCVAITLKCTDGEDEGVQVVWKTNSHGGRKAYSAVLQAVIAQIGEDPEHPVPVVALEADSYKHKEYGEIFTPDIQVKSWATMDGVAAAPAAEQVEDKSEKSEAAEEAAEPDKEEKPRRRRRRKTS